MTSEPETLAERLAWLTEGTDRLLAALEPVDAEVLSAPSLLPGWDRATVLGHLARNADALCNLVHWAASGVETPMYPDPAHRQADIARSAALPAAELLRDVATSAHRLDAAMASLGAPGWGAQVRTATGRSVPATEIPWLRVREVWIHLVDLDLGDQFADLPDRLVDTLLTEVARTMAAKGNCPTLRLEPTDRSRTWAVGTGNGTDSTTHSTTENGARVRGTAAELLGWLVGRPVRGVDVGGGPTLRPPAWL